VQRTFTSSNARRVGTYGLTRLRSRLQGRARHSFAPGRPCQESTPPILYFLFYYHVSSQVHRQACLQGLAPCNLVVKFLDIQTEHRSVAHWKLILAHFPRNHLTYSFRGHKAVNMQARGPAAILSVGSRLAAFLLDGGQLTSAGRANPARFASASALPAYNDPPQVSPRSRGLFNPLPPISRRKRQVVYYSTPPPSTLSIFAGFPRHLLLSAYRI